jgi:hypothetical protein
MLYKEQINMEVKKLYSEMISRVVSPPLKKLGYKKMGNAFYISVEGNWGIIDFQPSQKLVSNQITFSINIGIASKRVLNFLGFDGENHRPDIWDTQLRVRLGHLMPENNDIWWTVDQETNVDELGQLISDLVTKFAIPAIQAYITDESLRDLWIAGKSPSLTEFQRLLYLSVLAKQIGPVDILEPNINALQRLTLNKPSAAAAEAYINKLKDI